MNKLNEIDYKDAYGPEFEKFHKKWKSQKKDYSLFVQFTNFDVGYDNKVGYSSPDHSDPKGVYAYPLWYVVDHPGDIWYGAKASYLRVLQNVRKDKTLQLTYMDWADINNAMYHAKLHYYDFLEKNYKGITKMAQVFFASMQRKYTEKPTRNNPKGTFEVRSAEEQNKLLQKMGYWAIEDRASRASQAVINDREPIQICFLVPQCFKVLDYYRLKQHTKENPILTVPEPTTDDLRAFAQKLFRDLFNDVIVGGNKDRLEAGRNNIYHTYFSKGGRYIKIRTENVMPRDNLKWGEKPFKTNRKSSSWVIYVTLYCEYGTLTDSSDSYEDTRRSFSYEIHHGEKDPNWVPMTLQKFIHGIEAEENERDEKYRKEQQQKRLDSFDGIFDSWENVGKLMGMNVPNYRTLSDEEKIEFVEAMESMGNVAYHHIGHGEKNYADKALEVWREVFGEDYVGEEARRNYIFNFAIPIIEAAKKYYNMYTAIRGGGVWSLEREIEEKQQGIE